MPSLNNITGDRLEKLSEEDLEAIKLVVDPKSAEAFASNTLSEKLKIAAEKVDKAVKTEKTNRDITIYKPLRGDISSLSQGGTATMASFLAGTIDKPDYPKDGGLLRVRIPKGTNALKFPGQAYLLERGLQLELSPSEGNEINAKLITVSTEASSTGDIALVSPVNTFHQSGEHNQESHGNWAPDVPTEGPGRQITDEDRAIARRNGLSPEQVASIREYGHDPEDYDASGKPVPGTRSWQDAHGIEEGVYNSRPIKRYQGPNDPAIDEFYGDLPPNQKKFAKKIAGQEDGIIMNRTPVPGAEEEFGGITPQIRPDKKVLLDQRVLARKERELQLAKDRSEQVKGFKPDDIIKEREGKVEDAKKNLQEMKTSLPEDITERGRFKKEEAEIRLNKAKKTGDPVKIAEAEDEFKKADFEFKGDRKRATLLENDPGRAVSLAEQELRVRETSLARAKADPEGTLKSVQAYSDAQIPRKQEQLEGVRVKYVFPPGEGSASRIEANPDPQNIKNLTQGNGRVYFVMEGNIKSDAVLSQVKREDPKAAVISVPSVTAWPDGETDFVAKKYLKGRDVILIPDADGVKNPAVLQQTKKLRGKLISNGVENVIMAAPPVEVTKRGGFIVQKLRYPTGVGDERKGVDDHLGLGRGTLGDLVFSDTPPPRLDVSSVYKQGRKNINSVPNANKTISAISDLAGDSGIGRVSHKSIEKYTGLAPSSVNDSIKGLESTGIIKVHHIFDPKVLGHGRRVPAMEESSIRKITKRAGVPLPDLSKTYVSDADNHEVAPIIEIRNTSFITKSGPSKSLSSRFRTLRTSASAPKPVVEVGRPGIRIVRTPEGAKRYGVPIGQEIPEAEDVVASAKTSGRIHLNG